jgi:MFS family permease
MIQSFNVPTEQVAKYAGLTSAVFSLSQALTGIAWGRASDKLGRKPVILIALTCTMASSLLFGFSTSLAWAFIARSAQGLSNGNVGIIRTVVAEIVPEKELQPRAFSVMPLVWTIGSIFGPAFGGALVYPVRRLPKLFGKVKFLERFPFALPNLCISLLFLIGIVFGFFFLKESHEDMRDRKDYGRMLGSKITGSCTKRGDLPRSTSWRTQEDDEEGEAFLRSSSASSEMGTPLTKHASRLLPISRPSTSWASVFTRQSNINLLVYTLLAMHSVAYDQLVPVFMHHPVQSSHDRAVHLPFKFAGGFGLGSNRIGVLFMAYGVFGMLVQFIVFPPFARRYGVLNCLKACSLTFPFVYIATPFTALLPNDHLREGVMLALMLCKGWCAIFAFPCSTILLTNSASSLKVLGTLNGVATSISAVGRAAGPALAGFVFTVGVNSGYVAFSWWFLAIVAMTAAIPVFMLVEMDGFGGSGDNSSDGSESDDESLIDSAETSATQDQRAVRKLSQQSMGGVDEVEITGEDMPFLQPSSSHHTHSGSRRQSLSLRRIPSPIGIGPQGLAPPGSGARRYSTDMGYSRSGFGSGGTFTPG